MFSQWDDPNPVELAASSRFITTPHERGASWWTNVNGLQTRRHPAIYASTVQVAKAANVVGAISALQGIHTQKTPNAMLAAIIGEWQAGTVTPNVYAKCKSSFAHGIKPEDACHLAHAGRGRQPLRVRGRRQRWQRVLRRAGKSLVVDGRVAHDPAKVDRLTAAQRRRDSVPLSLEQRKVELVGHARHAVGRWQRRHD
eukprot:54260-Chlamydomonas_euryale.AAC.2